MINPEEKSKIEALRLLLMEIRVAQTKVSDQGGRVQGYACYYESYLWLLMGFAEGVADRMCAEKFDDQSSSWLKYVRDRIDEFKRVYPQMVLDKCPR